MVSTTCEVAVRCCWVVRRTNSVLSVTADRAARLPRIFLAPFSIAMTVALVSAWMPSMMEAMSAAEALDRSARLRTSSATTANP